MQSLSSAGKTDTPPCQSSSAGSWRTPVHEFIPVGPFTVRVKLTDDVKGENPDLLVAVKNIKAEVTDGWSIFPITSITDHEVGGSDLRAVNFSFPAI